MRAAYSAPTIFTGDNWLTDHVVVCENGHIISIEKKDVYPGEVISFSDGMIAPAFIDLQIYGAAGRLLAVYPDTESLDALVNYCKNGGAAFCLPTVATNTKEVFYRSIDAVRNYMQSGGGGILGIHLEGPWINPAKRGAHVESLVHVPTVDEVMELIDYGRDIIKIITLAPEVCSNQIIKMINESGIVISAGHSNATYEEAKSAFSNQISTVTHLFNAMSAFGHRAPGLAGATMDDERVMASIIPDGHHVDYAAIRIAKEVMKERLFAITDAVTETDKGHYQHYPAGDKFEAGGILSGSALTMNLAAKNLIDHAGIDKAEALRMCSLYPARVIKLDHELGMIKEGYRSSMVVLNDKLDVIKLISE